MRSRLASKTWSGAGETWRRGSSRASGWFPGGQHQVGQVNPTVPGEMPRAHPGPAMSFRLGYHEDCSALAPGLR